MTCCNCCNCISEMQNAIENFNKILDIEIINKSIGIGISDSIYDMFKYLKQHAYDFKLEENTILFTYKEQFYKIGYNSDVNKICFRNENDDLEMYITNLDIPNNFLKEVKPIIITSNN